MDGGVTDLVTKYFDPNCTNTLNPLNMSSRHCYLYSSVKYGIIASLVFKHSWSSANQTQQANKINSLLPRIYSGLHYIHFPVIRMCPFFRSRPLPPSILVDMKQENIPPTNPLSMLKSRRTSHRWVFRSLKHRFIDLQDRLRHKHLDCRTLTRTMP